MLSPRSLLVVQARAVTQPKCHIAALQHDRLMDSVKVPHDVGGNLWRNRFINPHRLLKKILFRESL
jgi:hypothetical protein